jgi:hypothetical protein
MLIGYVSDERYLALADVALEFVDARGRSWEARSRATGARWPGVNIASSARIGTGTRRRTSASSPMRSLGVGCSASASSKGTNDSIAATASSAVV